MDYMLEFSSDLINVGTVTVTVKGIGAYSGEASKTYTITALSIEGATVTLSEAEFTYDGEAKTPTVETIEVNGKSYNVILDTDYTIEYSNNISAGTATATITGKGNFTGVVEAHFTIAKLDLSEAEIILNGDEFEFVEGGVQPEVLSVMLNGKELTEGVDYEVDYADNESEGTGKVIITGIGNYEGKAEKTFMILLEGGGEEEGE
ncbi:MAG: hypothetical protein GX891_03805 [Clostridiales bacterium]|nr:hypothetical protein [Clostridiales bacterium]